MPARYQQQVGRLSLSRASSLCGARANIYLQQHECACARFRKLTETIGMWQH